MATLLYATRTASSKGMEESDEANDLYERPGTVVRRTQELSRLDLEVAHGEPVK